MLGSKICIVRFGQKKNMYRTPNEGMVQNTHQKQIMEEACETHTYNILK